MSVSVLTRTLTWHLFIFLNKQHSISYVVVCVIVGLAILVELRLVTDGQTEGRTDTR